MSSAHTIPVATVVTEGRYEPRRRMVGRRIIVFGAGQNDQGLDLEDVPPGNGRAIALLLAREGAGVACVDVDGDRAAATAAYIVEAGDRAVALTADVADEASVQRAIAQASEALGGLDGMVSNVGIARGGTLESTGRADLETVLRTNVIGQFLTLKHALPRMERGGAVVMMSAVAAFQIGPTPLPYDTSKAALEPLLRHAAQSGEPLGIRVNMVSPGAIRTPMAIQAFGGAHGLPWGREGTAWETAHSVLFLLSEESSYVNATTLVIDGGLTALH